MLVLSRKLNESIQIGDNITVTVVAIRNGQIRFGIDAPRKVPVVRSELIERHDPTSDKEPAKQVA